MTEEAVEAHSGTSMDSLPDDGCRSDPSITKEKTTTAFLALRFRLGIKHSSAAKSRASLFLTLLNSTITTTTTILLSQRTTIYYLYRVST